MKNDLINIEWDNVKCHICNNDDLEAISRNGGNVTVFAKEFFV